LALELAHIKAHLFELGPQCIQIGRLSHFAREFGAQLRLALALGFKLRAHAA